MKRREVVYIVIFLIILSGVIFLSHFSYLQRVEDYHQEKINELDLQINSVLVSHEDFSKYIYEKVVDDEFVLKTVHDAYDASIEEQADLRNELYDYLLEDYQLLSEFDIRQFHFHFPDTTSFLRMHKPEKFGDLLEDARYSVWYTNETHKVSIGYEEGKIFNGFRYVYPLEYNSKHIGSVEISLSVATIVNHLTAYNTDSDFGMVIERNVVEEKLFEDQLSNYKESSFSPDYLIDVSAEEEVTERNILNSNEIEKLLENSIDFDTKEYSPQLFTVKYDRDKYEVIFMPLENIQGKNVGYYYAISNESKLTDIQAQFRFELTMTILIFVVASYLLYTIESKRLYMKEVSETDQLTKIFNRRKLTEVMKVELERAKRYDSTFSVIMLDLDHFKKVNDQFGHQIGDKVLIELTELIQTELRTSDVFARYGGEEFIIVLPETNLAGAIQKAYQLRSKVEEHKFGVIQNLTVSLGVSTFRKELSVEEIIKKADEALYQAKTSGRNKVITCMEL